MKIVNIEEAKKEFIRFVDTYDLTNEKMNGKKYHSLRVMEISTKLAREENFSEEEIEVATLIGLLHDIARFKQYTEYQTFKDQDSFDHGNVGVEILERDNYLRKFIETDKYDNIIKLAIKNHNKFAIEGGLKEEQNKFCKLIRDADKIDIFHIVINSLANQEKEEMEKSRLNPDIKREFDDRKIISKKNYKKIEYADNIIHLLGFIFDLNYKSSFKIVKEQKYVDEMLNRFDFKDEYTKKEILKAKEETKQYILKKIEE